MEMILQTLSPVHIGSGDILSPYGDYVFKDGYIYYIDLDKISEEIYSRPDAEEIVDSFVEIIKTTADSNQASKYKLIDFMEDNNLDLDMYSKKKVQARETVNSREIQRIIATGNRPFIPGSTLKGAIRTSLLYSHLQKEDYDFNQMLRSKSYTGQYKFGKIQRDVFKHLQVTDTAPLRFDIIDIITTVRWDLVERSDSVPTPREVIPARTELKFRLRTTAKKDYDRLKGKFSYLEEDNEKEILPKINEFYIEALEKEIKILRENNPKDFKDIMNFYEGILNEAKELSNKNTGAILRIGAGKTFYENTVTNCLSDEEQNKIINKVKKGNAKIFPKTRTVVMESDNIYAGPGWIKISIKEGEVDDS